MASLKKRFVAEPETLFQGVILFKNSSRKNWRPVPESFSPKFSNNCSLPGQLAHYLAF
jgi:hypothetical protein